MIDDNGQKYYDFISYPYFPNVCFSLIVVLIVTTKFFTVKQKSKIIQVQEVKKF